jgi:hypothetical protein
MSENEQERTEERLEERQETKKELSPMDSKFPLLAEFRDKAPGSYKHAQSLVSMVENVCAAIDIDPDILKMAAMYHDIGKMWSPLSFTENQGKDDENIHDKLDPIVSYQIITRHVSDTVVILVANDFPKDVIRMTSQHHGNCILQAIYENAKKVDDSFVGREDLFRYKTPKPDSLESLILMLCDQVEATSRSLYVDQSMDIDPAVFVSNIYNKLHLDGQFDNVQVLLGKLKKIQAALISDVASNFQKRIRYEEDNDLVSESK